MQAAQDNSHHYQSIPCPYHLLVACSRSKDQVGHSDHRQASYYYPTSHHLLPRYRDFQNHKGEQVGKDQSASPQHLVDRVGDKVERGVVAKRKQDVHEGRPEEAERVQLMPRVLSEVAFGYKGNYDDEGVGEEAHGCLHQSNRTCI